MWEGRKGKMLGEARGKDEQREEKRRGKEESARLNGWIEQ